MNRSILRRLVRGFAMSAICLSLVACEVEEEIRLEADGTGSYRVKVMIEKEMGEVLSKLRSDAPRRGFTVVEEGETADRKFIVMARAFQDVAELNDDEDRYLLEVERSNPLTASYRLALDFGSNPSANGFSRTLRVFMPARVRSASAGTIDGSAVSWDCSHPGQVEIRAAGFAPTLIGKQRTVGVAVIAGGALLLAGLRLRRRRAASCSRCGSRLEGGLRFCPSCGAEQDGTRKAAA